MGGGGGGGGGVFTSANVDIVPDARLNALIVHAKPADLDTIEQLLKVLDQRRRTRRHRGRSRRRGSFRSSTRTQDIANIVQSLYQDRMSGPGAMMSPQEMMKMISGGPNTEQAIQKMSIAVDADNNLLIVRAPDPLFEEVQALVNELDQSFADSPETTRQPASLRHTNSAAVQKALTSLLPEVTSTTSSNNNQRGGNNGNNSQDQQDQIRHQMEQFQRIREFRDRVQNGGRGGGDRGGGGGDRGGRRRIRRRWIQRWRRRWIQRRWWRRF